MNSEEYDRMYRLEDSYWWFIGRHNLVLEFVRALYGKRTDLRILDLGCGTGAMSAKLAQHGQVVSADRSDLALTYSRKRGVSRLCAADAMRLPFRDGSFDLVVALDIFEHLADDHAAAREVARVLKPGGRIIVTVPAYRGLWSGHDVALMHARRYVAREVRDLFRSAALGIERLSYAMTALLPLVWVVRRFFWQRPAKPEASLVPVPRPVNAALVALLTVENKLVRAFGLPFGVSVFCAARRPEA